MYKAIKEKYEKVKGRNSGFAFIYFSDFENGLLKKMFQKNFSSMKKDHLILKQKKNSINKFKDEPETNNYTFLEYMSDEGEMESDVSFHKQDFSKDQLSSTQ
jgi:hypothetical protein